MTWLNILSARLRGFLRREAVIDDIEEEMRSHVELATEANICRGMRPDDARHAAMKSFGNLSRMSQLAYEVRGCPRSLRARAAPAARAPTVLVETSEQFRMIQ